MPGGQQNLTCHKYSLNFVFQQNPEEYLVSLKAKIRFVQALLTIW